MNDEDLEQRTINEAIGFFAIQECTIQELINELESYLKNFESQNIRLVPEGGYDGFYTYTVLLERLETDEEYNTRITKLKEAHRKKVEGEMKNLFNKKNLSTEEKENLIKYISEYK